MNRDPRESTCQHPNAGDPQGPLISTGGIRVHAPFALDSLDRAGIIIAPIWRNALETPPESALQAIRDAHTDGALVVSLCMGAFVLAATGLLDARRCTSMMVTPPLRRGGQAQFIDQPLPEQSDGEDLAEVMS